MTSSGRGECEDLEFLGLGQRRNSVNERSPSLHTGPQKVILLMVDFDLN